MTSLLVILVISASATVVGSVTICRSASCVGNSCSEVACDHGFCTKDGQCVCSPCWIGSSCNKYENDHYPEFVNQYEAVSVPNSGEVGDTVIQLTAVDADLALTCNSNATDCDCSMVNFAIESGNDDLVFRVDANSGLITLARPASEYSDRSFKLYVTVVNQAKAGADGGDIVGPKSYSTVAITLGSGSKSSHMDEDLGSVDENHIRHKRSVAAVSNMTFYLFKTGQYNFTTVMSVGTKVHFQLQIEFPIGNMDLLVELFTPDNTSTIMIICNPQIVWIGSNIKFNTSQAAPVMDSLDGSINYDRAVLDFGNVTNTGSTMNTYNDSMIIIEWDAIMIDSNATVNGSVYWVSAGAEYNSQNEIWIGQAGFTTLLDNYTAVSGSPSFNISSPSVMYLGTSAIVRVDMYLPIVVSDLVFEAFAPINYTDAMSVCTALIVGVGKNFECLQYNKIFPTFHSSASGLTNDRAILNIGHVINKGLREASAAADSVISVEFAVNIPYNETYIGQTFVFGATLEIGSDQIWAGQISVVIANTTVSPMSVKPALIIAPTTPVSILVPTAVELNLTLDNKTDTGYTLVITSVPGKTRICTILIAYQGINVPCSPSTLPVFSSTNNDGNNDKATWDLGRMLNTGHRTLTIDPQANVIQFKVIVQALNVSSNAIGSILSIGASVTPTQGTAASASGNIYINGTGSGSSVTSATVPVTNITFGFGTNSVNVNATTDVRVNVTLYPGIVYSPFMVEVHTPSNGSASGSGSNVFSICRMELMKVGKNLACLNQQALNSSIVYNTKVNGTPNYQAVLDFGSACSLVNSAYNASNGPTYDDSLELSVAVRVENNPFLVSYPTNAVGVGLTYGLGLLWLGYQSITAINQNGLGYGVNATPYVTFAAQNNASGTINATSPGSLVTFLVIIKLPPRSTADWKITADAGSDLALAVCSVRVKDFGYGVPCLNKSTPTGRPAAGGRQSGWLELYKLTNLGMQSVNANSTFDNNTVLVEIAVQVSPAALPGSFHGVNISADFGMNGADASANLSILVGSYIAPQYSASAPRPVFNFSQTPVNENATVSNNVYKGQTLIFTSELLFPYNSQNDIVVKFSVSPSDILDIVRYDAVFVGVNLPCLSKDMAVSNITASQFAYANDEAVLQLGTVCHFPIDTTLPENDKVIVEVIATVIRNTTLPLNQQFTVTSKLSVNGTDAVTSSITLTLSDAISGTEYLSDQGVGLANVIVNVTNGTIVPLEPADYYSVFADVVVPPNSTVFALVDFVMPVYQSAVLTIIEAHVVSFGCNLGSMGLSTDFNVTYNSSNGTSQNDTAYINLGKITNTGHTFRSGKYLSEDDYIRVSLTVRMADCAAAIQNSLHYISFGAKLGFPIFFRTLPVRAIRTLTEVPDILLSVMVNTSFVYSTGAMITVTGGLWHSNFSKAEGYNTTLMFYPPKYIQFGSLKSTNFIGPVPTVVNITGSTAFGLEFSHFYFTDIVNFTLTIEVLQMTPGSGRSEDTSTGFELITNIIYRSSHVNQSGTPFITPLENLNFTIAMPLIPACASVPLGMESGFIKDCQITGSVSPDPNFQPVNGRLSGGPNGWKPGWHLGHSGYLQVNFGNLTRVTAVTLKNPLSNSDCITSFQMFYSNDGFNWIAGDSVSVGSPYTTVKYNLISMADAVYVRFTIPPSPVPSAMPLLQLEFHGCVTATLTVPVADVCSTRNGWQPPSTTLMDFYNRGFLVSNGAVYFCDTNPSGGMSCFSSNDGTIWKIIDGSVVNVNTYLPVPGQLYGIDWKKRAYLVSEDQGTTWMSVSSQRHLWAKAQSGLLLAFNLTSVNNAVFNPSPSDPTTGYIDPSGKWGAKYNGLFYSGSGTWKQVADWM